MGVLAIVALLLAVPALAMSVAGKGRASDAPDSRVVNGHPAGPYEYPFAVAILDSSQRGKALDQAFCTGAVIAPTWVMTAAHCLDGQQARKVRVLAGTNFLLNRYYPGVQLRAAELLIHPGYDGEKLENDVALIRLREPIPAWAYAPIELVAPGDRSYEDDGSSLTIVGWGSIGFGSSMTNELMAAEVEAVGDADCADVYNTQWWGEEWFFLPASVFCASGADPERNVCFGDSGSSIFAKIAEDKFVSVGVSSWIGGDQCAMPGYPGGFTRLSNTELNTWVRTTAGLP